jgi:hypothetical protein
MKNNFWPLKIEDRKLAEWLASNPLGERHSLAYPVVGLGSETFLFRWPFVDASLSNEPN